MRLEPMKTLEIAGDTWRILGTGACRNDEVICHLASTTRFHQQRNGRVPVQTQQPVLVEIVETAMNRPRGFFGWNRALQSAFCKGEQAAREGATKTDCPYIDKRKGDGRLTWSRSFRAAWRDGFDHHLNDLEKK